MKQETGLDSSIGIGPNRMIAKLASDQAKPRGLMEIRAGWEQGFLAGLPLRALPGVGPKTAERWASIGLTEVRQIQEMELQNLQRLLGDHAQEAQASGPRSRIVSPERRPAAAVGELGDDPLRDATDKGRLDALLALFVSRVAGTIADEE